MTMAARSQVQQRLSGIDNDDLVLLDDLLGIRDPAIAMPQIDPDARRRRLSSIVNAAALARVTPSLFVIEDVHWVDGISESMLAEFLNVVPETNRWYSSRTGRNTRAHWLMHLERRRLPWGHWTIRRWRR